MVRRSSANTTSRYYCRGVGTAGGWYCSTHRLYRRVSCRFVLLARVDAREILPRAERSSTVRVASLARKNTLLGYRFFYRLFSRFFFLSYHHLSSHLARSLREFIVPVSPANWYSGMLVSNQCAFCLSLSLG